MIEREVSWGGRKLAGAKAGMRVGQDETKSETGGGGDHEETTGVGMRGPGRHGVGVQSKCH